MSKIVLVTILNMFSFLYEEQRMFPQSRPLTTPDFDETLYVSLVTQNLFSR